MTLYTEEQVNELRRALRDISQWDESFEDDWEDAGYRAMDSLKSFNKLKPIELPSDEDIKQEFKYSSENWEVRQALEEGAKWMREQLKQRQ